MIVCVTRDASRGRMRHVRHVFAGDWDGPDGELPPLDEAKTFAIVETVWIKTPTSASEATERE